jgi:beta-glucosidase
VFSMMGYETGVHAPGRRGRGFVAARHALLAHAAAAAEFGGLVPGGRLSVNVNGDWAEPWDAADPADVAAAERSLDLGLHLFGDPLFTGQWPASVLAAAPPGAHPFSPVESAALRAAAPSYFALNFYTAAYVRDAPGAVDPGTNAVGGFLRAQATGPASAPIGDAAESAWLRKTPWAMRSMLNHVASRYGVPIVVTENGCSAPGEGAGKSKKAALNDDWRVDYYRRYLDAATDAVNDDGVPLRRYFAWSLLDNFEWADGYGALFGVTYVDWEDPNLNRTLKASGRISSQIYKIQREYNNEDESTMI